MAALMQAAGGIAASRAGWTVRRALRAAWRRWGALGGLVACCLLAAAIAQASQRQQLARLLQVQARWVAAQAEPSQPALQPVDDDRSRLGAFDAYLPPSQDMAAALQDLLQLAEREGLVLKRGEYKAQPEPQGGFLRYRMTLPLRGDAQAIHRFMTGALRQQKTLALESVQFKREHAGSGEIEARMQWVLLTRLPGRADGLAAPQAAAALAGSGR